MMVDKTIKVAKPMGLHLRAAAQLVGILRKYHSKVLVQKGLGWFNAKSVICLLQLAAVFGAELHFILDGDDATQALDAIQKFLENRVL